MASALDLVVHIERLTGGARKVASISEVTGMEGDTISLQDIFRWQQTGVDSAGKASGQFEACGVRPQLLPRLVAEGIKLPPDMFQYHVLSTTSPAKDEGHR
jgi:pilus assembly protein CpaF